MSRLRTQNPDSPEQAAQPPVFVLNSLQADISVIDPESWVETARIPTGKEPHHL